jgi:hypothetical protein
MADHERLTPVPAGAAVVRSCWMCGIGLSAGQMVADGGSACADVRWYCRDTRGCTERWTSARRGRPTLARAVGGWRRRGASSRLPDPEIAGAYAACLTRTHPIGWPNSCGGVHDEAVMVIVTAPATWDQPAAAPKTAAWRVLPCDGTFSGRAKRARRIRRSARQPPLIS